VIERFSTHAREALAAAEREARSLKHSQIGTEHVLLGLLRIEESVAAQALRLMGVTHRKARRRITGLVDVGPTAPAGPLAFTPRVLADLGVDIARAATATTHVGMPASVREQFAPWPPKLEN
jgi:ATP-dependent Clp protease ATP-binding subunit ClpC